MRNIKNKKDYRLFRAKRKIKKYFADMHVYKWDNNTDFINFFIIL